jgi:hypothetical protein
MRTHCRSVILVFPVLLSLACSDSSTCGHDGGAAPDLLMTPAPDLGSPTDMFFMPRCELPYDVRLIDKVSMGGVTVTKDPGGQDIYTAQVDATAGGSMKYGENPFIYMDLIGQKKVELTDVQAQNSGAWDIAFKRWQIKINSGDSGTSNVTVARVPDKNLDEVTAAPAGPYLADTYFDADCKFTADPIGGIGTVLSDWYEYESGTNRLKPIKEVLVFPRRDGHGHIKLQLLSYYQGSTSGNFTMTWSFLH